MTSLTAQLARVLTLVGLLGVATLANADDDGWRPMWLAVDELGDKAIDVLSNPLDSSAIKAGLTERMVRDTVELALRRNKIPIASPDSPYATPKLEVNVRAMTVRSIGGEYVLDVWNIDVALWIVVRVKPIPWFPTRWIRTDIWRNGAYGFASTPDELKEFVRETILQLGDDLSLDYLRAGMEHDVALQEWRAKTKGE